MKTEREGRSAMKINKKIIAAAVTCLIMLAAFSLIFGFWNKKTRETGLKRSGFFILYHGMGVKEKGNTRFCVRKCPADP